MRAAVDLVDIVQTDVEPDGRIEGPILVYAKPCQIQIKVLRILLGKEIPILPSAIGDGPANPMDELFDGVFPIAGVDIAVKIFAYDYFCGKLAPVGGDFHIFLFKDGFACIIGNFCLPGFPFGFFKGMSSGFGKMRFYFYAFFGLRVMIFPWL